MADLQQIFGAILRDLAKARFSSDLYSRSVARYYEANDLLRKFPVPRADIEEVDIDLKFSITDVTASDVDHESQEANSSVLFERTVERLVSTFLNLAYEREVENPELAETRQRYVQKGFGSGFVRVECRINLLRYFIESYRDLIDDEGNFNTQRALDSIERPFRWALEHFAFDEYRPNGPLRQEMKERIATDITAPVARDDRIRAAVQSLEAPLKGIWKQNSDARLDVLVEGSQLSQLAEGAVSTVRVKAVVKNMIWTEVVVDEYTKRHALTPE
ncbi:MAG: hypothetical protein AAFX10_03115 [Pseudomonadota bacterium]